jgi:hypothetical protein
MLIAINITALDAVVIAIACLDLVMAIGNYASVGHDFAVCCHGLLEGQFQLAILALQFCCISSDVLLRFYELSDTHLELLDGWMEDKSSFQP